MAEQKAHLLLRDSRS